MSQIYGLPELDELDEAYDDALDEAYDDFDEARRPGRRPPVKTAPGGSAYRPRPNTSNVTQAQLQAALARVNAQIATNSTAVKTLDGRVRGVTTEQTRVTAALRKEIADRKREEEVLRKEVQSTRELAAILPIIARDNPMLGLLAMGGGGSLFGGGGTTGGDSTSNLLMMALVFGDALKPKP